VVLLLLHRLIYFLACISLLWLGWVMLKPASSLPLEHPQAD